MKNSLVERGVTKKQQQEKGQTMKIKKAVLVYQAGLANVFAVDCFNMAASGRKEQRLIQGDFRTCEAFAQGLAAAGVAVASAACNKAGDIARSGWEQDLENQPFSDKFCPVWSKVAPDLYFETRKVS